MAEKLKLEQSSPEQVALELANRIAAVESIQGTEFRKKYLDLYAECLDATTGARSYR